MAFRRRYRKSKPRRARNQSSLVGFTAAELGAKVGITARTVRFYASQRLLPEPQFRGRNTRYVREHLVQLAAIRHLQGGHRLALEAIREQLARLTPVEIERLAVARLPELAPPAPAPAPAPNTGGERPTEWLTGKWQRVTVLPGLEVHLQEGAGDVVRDIANQISHAARRSWFERLTANPGAGSALPAAPTLLAPPKA